MDATGSGRSARALVRRILLACGIAAPLLYLAMNVVGAMQFEGYNSMSQTVSELSAIGAPSRPLWVALAAVYDVLAIAFGLGVWAAADARRPLRVVGVLVIVHGLAGFVWPPAHQRGGGFSTTDVLHIVVTAVVVLNMVLTMGFGAALGRRFRLYSIASIVVHVVFGAMAGLDGSRIAANLPTPWAGLTQRVNIGAYMLWTMVLAITLLRASRAAAPERLMATPVRSGLR